jgi:hypothetical protein
MHKRATALLIAIAATFLLISPAARATQPIGGFEVTTSTTQAGGHPDLSALVELESPGEPEAAKELIVEAPEGVFGNPRAIDQCTSAQLSVNECPVSSQAGLVTVRAKYLGNPNYILGTAPIFAMEPREGEETALFSFVVPTVDIPVYMPVEVRTATDYGLRFRVSGITQEIPVSFVHFTLWGFPAESGHDEERFGLGKSGSPPGCPGQSSTADCELVPRRAGINVHPLTDNPTVCTGEPLPVMLEVRTYQDPEHLSHAESDYPATTGCENEEFDPVFQAALTSQEADSASGLDLQFKAPQFLGYANAPSSIRSASLVLPKGISINPDAADGQTYCPDALANFGTEKPAECPDNAKIGTYNVRTPALEKPLVGALYFGEPKPGNQYRVIMVADGSGIHSKLVAKIFPDLETGQLSMVLPDLPQVPFEEFNLHAFASQRGLVASPTNCTIYTADALFVPWNSDLPPQHSAPNFSITSGPGGSPCPGQVREFHPRLKAGTSNPDAGASSDFTLKLDRDDGDQYLGDLNFRLAPGFTGSLRGIPYCSEAAIAQAAQKLGRVEQASPSCPIPSQVGTTNVAAGPGSHPFNAVGKMYLAGPFKGAPLSVVAITPALAGPYDYGTVVVRVALHIDPQTAQVFAASDTVPSIIGGVPIRMRSIQVNIDRPNFAINPTNCSPLTVDSQGIGDQGTVSDFSSYFQVVNCTTMPFKPKMTMSILGGRKSDHRAVNPALQVDLNTRPGDSNIQSLSVTLPNAFEIDQRHLGNICSEKELAESQCAGRTPIGMGMTTTPLLDQPLSGPVYAVSGSGGLPRLAFILDGQVDLVPRADTQTVGGGRLQTTVPVVPDAPIGHFHLKVFGGKVGYLINTRNLCARPPLARVDFTAQNAKTRSESVKIKAPCGKSKARHRRDAHR